MTSNFFNPNDWEYVSEYTKADGTQVRSYWRHRYGKNILPENQNYNKKTGFWEVGINNDDFTEKPTFNELKDASEAYVVENMTKQDSYVYGGVFAKLTGNNNAYELYKLASSDINYNEKYVKRNGKMYSSTAELHDKKLAQKIKARLYTENTGMNDCKIFEINADSALAKKIVNSDEMKEELAIALQIYRKFGVLPMKTLEFKKGDLYNALHGVEVLESRFDASGNLHITLGDLYNFNAGRTSARGQLGEKFQNQGLIEPYYLKINIVISKNELEKY